jgi:hypothetical protein
LEYAKEFSTDEFLISSNSQLLFSLKKAKEMFDIKIKKPKIIIGLKKIAQKVFLEKKRMSFMT